MLCRLTISASGGIIVKLPGTASFCAEIIPEGDVEFGAGFVEAEKGIAAIASGIAAGSAGDFALGDLATDVVFRAVGVERHLPACRGQREEFGFVRVQAFEQTIEGGPEPVVRRLKMRSKRADKVALRAGDGLRRQALRLR